MIKQIKIQKEYLYLPIQIERKEKLFEIFCIENDREIKVMEFMIPVGEDTDGVYPCDYLARFPVKQFTDKTLTLKGDVPEAFMKEILNSSFIAKEPLRRPSIHFTAERGWINDPNGLVYKDGYYHLYFQYNPCNTKWNNMCWGHAVSKDLLHWQEKDIVLTPDEDGMMFSGSGLVNEGGMLDLPADAILYFYSAAGGCNHWSNDKLFTQKMAYSLDNGDSLIKTETGKLDTISKENRDPKVFWHEESKAFIMCLWLEENNFAILRSVDLMTWKMTDRLTFQDAWECPDLVRIPAEDGKGRWMFWSADGFYYWGEFDGYRFTTDYKKHNAYINRLPYAAQTYGGIKDRVVSVSWIRSSQEGRLYNGCMGLPRELSVISDHGEWYLSQQPVRELRENSKLIYEKTEHNSGNNHLMLRLEKKTAISLDMIIKPEAGSFTLWKINKITVSYEAETGIFTIGNDSYPIGERIKDFSFLLDDVIFEVSAKCGIILGAFELPESWPEIEADLGQFERINIYEICDYSIS